METVMQQCGSAANKADIVGDKLEKVGSGSKIVIVSNSPAD